MKGTDQMKSPNNTQKKKIQGNADRNPEKTQENVKKK